MKQLLYLLFILAFTAIFSCKTKPAPVTSQASIDPVLMEKMWKKIDSLEQKGLVTSALKEVQEIKKTALGANDSGNLVKAIVHENKYLLQLEEDPDIKALSRLENEINTYPEPARSVMHSLAAQWYTQYLQSHLWVLRNRT